MATPNSDIVIEARGLTKIFRDFWGRPKARAVNSVDFTVMRGQVFGLLGPNGSGKSTTVKMLLGLLYPTRGKLQVLGRSPRDVDTKRRIGYLPEESYLYRYLTASESLDFFGALFGIPKAERLRRGEQLLEMVGLASAWNRPVGEFSKGMARRIGLAQALINDPELVLLDEPTAGLDPIGCREVKDVIRLLAERGKTVVLCSHLLADVEDVCDQVMVLYGGKVCAHGGLRDMLKIEDKTRIVTPQLTEETLQQVLAVVRAHVSEQDIRIDSPSMNLEELFLDIVRRAREAAMDTAGAQSGGRIAAYLHGDEEVTVADERAKVLAALTGDEDVPGPDVPPAAAEPVSQVDGDRLRDLTANPPVTKSAGADAAGKDGQAVSTLPDAGLKDASEKLQKMLRDKGPGRN